MDLHAIARQRLLVHRINGTPCDTPEAVVGWLGAMQAQDYPLATWSVGLRTTDPSEARLHQALADGTILRTHLLRPTWHFVLPADLRWLMTLTGPRVQVQNAGHYRQLELDDRLFARTNAILASKLSDRARLTRRDLGTALERHGIAASGVRLAYIMMRAELDLVITSGGLKGKQQTYALVDEVVPESAPFDRGEALAQLARRYLTGRGPATIKDLAWWSGLTVADATRGVELAKDELESMTGGGRTYWVSTRTPPQPRATTRTVHLLQGFDEYIIAYSESRDVVDVAGLAGAGRDQRPPFLHAVVADGQMVGRWRRLVRPRAMTIEVQLLTALSDAQRAALTEAVDRYGRFVGLPTNILA